MPTLRNIIDGKAADSVNDDLIKNVGDTEEAKMNYEVAKEKLRTHLLPQRAVMDHLDQRHDLNDLSQTGQMQTPYPGNGNPNAQKPGVGQMNGRPGMTNQKPNNPLMPGQQKAMTPGKGNQPANGKPAGPGQQTKSVASKGGKTKNSKKVKVEVTT